MSGLEIRIDRKAFPGAPALFEGFACRQEAGEFLALTGPSGCGKTTILNIVAGLDRDYAGSVRFDRADGMAARPVLSYMFQEPRLLPWRTVTENLTLVLPKGPERPARAAEWLARVGLADCGGLYPGQLSMGMARRVALARAFCVQPDLLLMDEPFVSLDPDTADELRELLRGIRRDTGATILFVSHDLDEVIALADRMLLLSGPPTRILQDVPIGLPEAERRDRQAVSRFRATLDRHAQPHLVAVGGGGERQSG